MKTSRILVTGSVAYDLILSYDGSFVDSIDPKAISKLSVAFVTRHFSKHHGGTGANIAWSLQLLGQDPLLVSTVGRDGGPYIELLKTRGINTDNIQKKDTHMTATSIIGTDDMEHQITFYHPGADSAGSWPELDTKDNNIQYAIVSPRDRLIMMQAVRWCEKEKIPFLFDPGQQITSLSNDELREGLDKGSGLIVNDYEWDMFSERLSLTPTEALERANIIIITHEEKGLSLHTREGQIDVAACTPDMVVNPTGAGDALRGGMLTGLNLGWPLTQSARLGASVASFVVQTEGTLVDDLTVEEVCERAKKNYGEALPALE